MEILQQIGIIPVGSIVVICVLVGQVMKATPLDNKYLPAIVGVLGLILGVAGKYLAIAPFMDFDLYQAGAMGIVSGLAAAGLYDASQMFGGNKR